MDKLKSTIAANIAALRTNSKLTQAELAEKLGYSDKSISKWERGESVPDIYVLKNIADIFNVSVDYILQPYQSNEKIVTRKDVAKKNHLLISSISVIGVLLLATVAFAAVWAASGKVLWIIFIDCLPVCSIVLLVFNTLWFKKKNNLYFISLLIWTSLTALYLTLLVSISSNYWQFFLVGVPAQIVTPLCFGIKIRRNRRKTTSQL